MTRIRIYPEAVRRAGLEAVNVASDHTSVVSMLRSLGLPAMPSDMQRAYEARIDGAAGRLREVAAREDGMGVELQLKATAAEAADAPGGEPTAGAGRRVSSALGMSGSIVDVTGAAVAVTVTVAGGVVTAKTASGVSAAVDPQKLVRTSKAGQPQATTASKTTEASTRTKGPPDASKPTGGLAATTVRNAVTRGGAGGATDPAVRTAGTAGIMDDTITAPAGGRITAERSNGKGGVPVRTEVPEPGREHAPQDWACWMAGRAAHAGVPPELPLMMALSQSGMRNMASAGSAGSGFFSVEAGSATAPAGYGLPPTATPDETWWMDHPGAQLDHVIGGLQQTSGGTRGADLSDGDGLGRWAADAFPGASAEDYAGAHESAKELVEGCKQTAPAVGSAAMGGKVSDGLGAAQRELGVREVGVNTGPEVNRYLASADVGPGNPWCGGFVTWSLEQGGKDMPGTGWAAVANWVNAAQAGQHGLSIVDAAQARPGDIVAYDWGGGGDYGSDAHMGFLESEIGQGGQFTTVEGNSGDAVTRMQRSLGSGNPVFIRVSG